MNFVEFVTITRPILGGKGGVHVYVRTLFDAILTENGKEILDGYSKESYKAYAGAKTSIRDISKAMVQYIDPVEFSSFIFKIPGLKPAFEILSKGKIYSAPFSNAV